MNALYTYKGHGEINQSKHGDAEARSKEINTPYLRVSVLESTPPSTRVYTAPPPGGNNCGR
jgi:hypothetical protein